MKPQIGHGIDVSKWQDPDSVPFAQIANDRPEPGWITSCYVRATYGSRHDARFAEHVDRAWAAGFDRVGAYHFFRIAEEVQAQCLAFYDQTKFAGLNAQPVLDVEADGKSRPTPDWVPRIVEALNVLQWDSGLLPILYTNWSSWEAMGRPSVLLAWPWWIAHYTTKPRPAAPEGAEIVAWQHCVAPYRGPHAVGGVAGGRGVLDQNRIYA